MWTFTRKLGEVILALAVIFLAAYFRTRRRVWYWLSVVFVTAVYHVAVRTLVANTVNGILHNRVDYTRRWFRVSAREERLYRKLNVKRWKSRMPTYDPESFNPKTHSWEEIAQTTCQSEIVHETNILLSFLPVAAARWVDWFWGFLLSSALIAGIESLFVVMQRYNRGRIVKLLERRARRGVQPC